VTADNVSHIEAKAALQEVLDAHDQMQSEDGAPRNGSQGSDLTEKQVEVFRARATRQRTKGKKDLERRHDGVASFLANVQLKERVIGSVFQRYFAAIENGVYVITHRGEMVIGEAGTSKIMTRVDAILEEIDLELTTMEAALQIKLDVAASASEFIKPTYTGNAAQHEVQIRTKTARAAMNLFVRYDRVLQGFQTLFWNDNVEEQYIQDLELQAKKSFGNLYKFISSSVRGMRNKAVAATAAATEAANGAAEKMAEGAIAEAA
jgi:hypothetical protein